MKLTRTKFVAKLENRSRNCLASFLLSFTCKTSQSRQTRLAESLTKPSSNILDVRNRRRKRNESHVAPESFHSRNDDLEYRSSYFLSHEMHFVDAA